MEQEERLLQEWKDTQQASDILYRDYSIEGDSVFVTLSPPETGQGFYVRRTFTLEGVQEAISILTQVIQHIENQTQLNKFWAEILGN